MSSSHLRDEPLGLVLPHLRVQLVAQLLQIEKGPVVLELNTYHSWIRDIEG